MNASLAVVSNQFLPGLQRPRLILVEVAGSPHREITELIARLALRGPFHIISSGQWLPDQDSLRRSVRRYTVNVKETLDRISLGRPATCLQLRDQLEQAASQSCPVLALNFLNHFFDPDVDLSLRRQVLEQCCRLVKLLSFSKPVVALLQQLPSEEYREFHGMLAPAADEIIESAADAMAGLSQPVLL